MGAKIFAIITLVMILTSVTLNTKILNERIDEILGDVENHSHYDDVLATKDKYLKYQRFISISVSHKDLMNIEDLFSEYEAEVRLENENKNITKSRLISALKHLKRLSAINIDSII